MDLYGEMVKNYYNGDNIKNNYVAALTKKEKKRRWYFEIKNVIGDSDIKKDFAHAGGYYCLFIAYYWMV